jgi:hypothetical protein
MHPIHSPRMVLDHTYLMWLMYNNFSRSHQHSWAGPLLPRKRASDTIHNKTVDWSMGPYPVSLPIQPMNQWGQSQPYVGGRLLGLPGLYHRHAISTFNTCSRGVTHRSLTDTGGGYKLGGVGFPHTTPRLSQLTVSTFHLKVPPGLQFNQSLPKVPKFKFKERTYDCHVVFQPLNHLP